MSFSYLTFWPCFTFSSSVILLCFFRPGLAQFLGYTLGSLLDCQANSLPALLHLATLEKSLSKLGLDRGSSDLGTIFMGMIFWFTSVQFSRVWPFVTPWMAASQAPLSITNSRSLLKLMSFELVMPSNHRILCRPLLLLPSIFPSIGVFSNESVLCIRWPKYWSFSFSISPSNEYSGLISLRMDWLDLLAVQVTLESLLQHHSSKASILWCWLLVSWFKKFRFLLMTHLIKKGTERNLGWMGEVLSQFIK